MKFKGKISKELLLSLCGVTATFEKIGNNAAIFLNEDSMRIAVISDSVETPRCYSELKMSSLFLEYKIESQSDNTILFEIGLSQLSKALASGKYSSHCQMRLVKRDNQPCLCIETKANESVMSVDVSHDIPIRVFKPEEIIHYMPPEVPPPTVALDLPKNKLMKTVIDKMMKFSKHVSITGYQCGRLILKAEHSSVVIRTYYNGLQPRFIGQLNAVDDIDNQAVVKLNLRKFSVVMNMTSLLYESASLFLSSNEVVMLHISLSPTRLGSVTYFLPVLLLGEEDEELAGAGGLAERNGDVGDD